MDEMRLKMQLKRKAIAGGGGGGGGGAPKLAAVVEAVLSVARAGDVPGGSSSGGGNVSRSDELPLPPRSRVDAPSQSAAPTSPPADTGIFSPESMHGFKASLGSPAAGRKKKKRDSDDWSTSDED